MSTQTEIAAREIEEAVCGLANMVEVLDELLTTGEDVPVAQLHAVLALAQKSGALLERGLKRTGRGPGIWGDADTWITDPNIRRHWDLTSAA